MSLIVPPARNPIVAAAFAGLKKDERRMKRIASMTRAKPEPSNPKPRRDERGKTKKAKP